MTNPALIVQQFYAAVGRGDYAAAREFLGEPFSFVGWFDSFDTPEGYIDAVRKLRGFIVKIDVHKVFVDEGDVCLFYDAHTARGASTLVAGWFRLREDKIVNVRIVCDPRPFAEFWGRRSVERDEVTTESAAAGVEHLLRELAPRVLGAVARRFGDFAAAEDAVQEALLAAALQWPKAGVPDNPGGWLFHVASRRMTDHVRSEQARRRRETIAVEQTPYDQQYVPAPDSEVTEQDDTLVVLFMCCHPALTPASAIALTLRAVGGLTTGEIASAFLVPEATMAQRISRAKQRIKTSGVPFQMPMSGRTERLRAVLHVLYLIFNEGYTSSTGPQLQRVELSAEAIRLARGLHRLLPDDGEVAGLLALMLLTDARRAARTGPDGELIPLDEQDRNLWDRKAIRQGVALVTAALSGGSIGAYQLQAAIAALHDEAPRVEETDWPQILALYGVLLRMSDNPMVALNHAIAAAMVNGPSAGLELLKALDADARIAGHYRLDAVRAHLLELAGDHTAAIAHYRAAAGRTASLPERHYLMTKASRIAAET